MNVPTLYEILGVTPAASPEEIKSAYRRLMRAAHPDTGGTAGLFRAVQLAYDTLTDPARRAAYDDALRRGDPRVPYVPTPQRGSDSAPDRAGTRGTSSAGGGTSPGASSNAGADGSEPTDRPTSYSSLFHPMERPPHAETARVGAVFDPPLFADDESPGTRRRRGIGPVGFRGGRGREPRAATDILPMNILRQRILGTPGEAISAAVLGGRGAALAREADRRTEELIDAAVLPAYPAMRLIHDLRDPGSREKVIDHAVVVGDRAVLIDSLMVDGGAYTWDGEVLGGSPGAPVLTLPKLMDQARLWLDPWKVSGAVVLHSTNGRLSEPTVTHTGPADPAAVTVLDPMELVEYLREAAVLEARTHVVNVRLLRAVLQLRPEARLRG
ncbi:MAG TPA: DnaJ domain-containing protein [Actinomycetaceae bacterium]|nr:DnaJ domain-containing protein [Actinomycetaceae bacterium]